MVVHRFQYTKRCNSAATKQTQPHGAHTLLWVHDPKGYSIHKAWFTQHGLIILCEELTILAMDQTGNKFWSHDGPDVIQSLTVNAGEIHVFWFNGAQSILDEQTGELVHAQN